MKRLNISKNTKVLIVEDDPMVSQMIQIMIKKAGFTVAGKAPDGQQALKMLATIKPDVVLMDIEMPNMDGLEATRYIQARHPTPVVILTAYETSELLQQASTAGAGAYLTKPPSPGELERAIIIAMARFDDMMQLRETNMKLRARNKELKEAMQKVQTLSGLVPICASCKDIRTDEGFWQQVEVYIESHSEAEFTHSLCPKCAQELYPEIFKGKNTTSKEEDSA